MRYGMDIKDSTSLESRPSRVCAKKRRITQNQSPPFLFIGGGPCYRLYKMVRDFQMMHPSLGLAESIAGILYTH